jgi:hypothetical protein
MPLSSLNKEQDMHFLRKFAATLILMATPLLYAATITQTITDPDGNLWGNGTWAAVLVVPGGANPTSSGIPLTPAQINVSGSMSAAGILTATVLGDDVIDQAGDYWAFTICSNTSATLTKCYTVNTTITGASTATPTLVTGIVAPRFTAGPTAYGYANVEVFPVPSKGERYFNTTLGQYCSYSNPGWICSGNTAAITSGSITGVTIDNSVIGGTTPAAGTFTNVFVPTGGMLRSVAAGGLSVYAPNNITNSIIVISDTGFPLTVTSGNVSALGTDQVQFSPPSGSANFADVLINPVINGTSTGTAYGLVVAPKTNVLTGGTVYDACFGSSTGANLSGLVCNATITPTGAAVFTSTNGVSGSEEVVTFSATPAFSASTLSSIITISANVTSWTLSSGLYGGQQHSITWCENGTGGFTVTGTPANVRGAFNPFPATTLNTCSTQVYKWTPSLGTPAWLAVSAGSVNQ